MLNVGAKKQGLSNENKRKVALNKKKKPRKANTEQTRNQKKQQIARKNDRSKKKPRGQKSKRRKQQRRKPKQKFFLKEFSITLLISVLLISLVLWFTVQLPKVEGYSMTPTINDQDRLFVSKKSDIRRFSLVSFKSPKEEDGMIRRVIGLPGEKLYYQQGSLFINGEEIPERFLSTTLSEFSEEPQTADFTLKEVLKVDRVPEDSYFVLGDNRLYATDSRYFGFVKKKNITGVVKARIFPIHAMRQF